MIAIQVSYLRSIQTCSLAIYLIHDIASYNSILTYSFGFIMSYCQFLAIGFISGVCVFVALLLCCSKSNKGFCDALNNKRVLAPPNTSISGPTS